jgi:hypothetical protein
VHTNFSGIYQKFEYSTFCIFWAVKVNQKPTCSQYHPVLGISLLLWRAHRSIHELNLEIHFDFSMIKTFPCLLSRFFWGVVQTLLLLNTLVLVNEAFCRLSVGIDRAVLNQLL